MNRAQTTAFSTPCLLAGECVNPQFARILNLTTSAVLTINTGYE
jgi:hypothetical protein